MPRWACRLCGCLYAAGAPCCPDCRATEHDEEDEVPKIDRFGVATIGAVTTGHASAILPDGAVVPPAEVKPAAAEEPAEPPVVVPVADQKAAGIAPEDTVTIAEQKAGTPPPVVPPAPAQPPSKPATPPPAPPKKGTP